MCDIRFIFCAQESPRDCDLFGCQKTVELENLPQNAKNLSIAEASLGMWNCAFVVRNFSVFNTFAEVHDGLQTHLRAQYEDYASIRHPQNPPLVFRTRDLLKSRLA